MSTGTETFVAQIVDENPLVTQSEINGSVQTKWSDKTKTEKNDQNMAALGAVRIGDKKEKAVEYPEPIIAMAVQDVLSTVGWFNYESFLTCTTNIVNKNFKGLKFASRVTDKKTNKQDFWLIKGFIDVRPVDGYAPVYEHNGVEHNKITVLTSDDFTKKFREICQNIGGDGENGRLGFKGKVAFRILHGSQLEMGKFYAPEMKELHKMLDVPVEETIDPNMVVMIQFKKNIPSLIIGGSGSKQLVPLKKKKVVAKKQQVA